MLRLERDGEVGKRNIDISVFYAACKDADGTRAALECSRVFRTQSAGPSTRKKRKADIFPELSTASGDDIYEKPGVLILYILVGITSGALGIILGLCVGLGLLSLGFMYSAFGSFGAFMAAIYVTTRRKGNQQ